VSIEHERALLGQLFLDPGLLDRERIGAELFEDRRHSVVLEALRALREAGQPVNLLTVHDSLGARIEEAGGVAYLAGLTNTAGSAANAAYYVGQLREGARLRALRRLNLKLADSLQARCGAEELLQLLEVEVVQLRRQQGAFQTVEPADALRAVIDRAERRMREAAEGPSGIPSGFSALDRLTGGFQPADLVLIAARTSVGKSSLALSFIERQIVRGYGVALASLETPALQLWERLLSMRSGVSTGRLRFGHLSTEDFRAFEEAANRLSECSLRILDRPDLSVQALRAWACHEVGQGARILYVDYVGLLSGGDARAPRWERMADISKGLKAVARELEMPVVALVQLNREAADAREPGLHHLRDSGAFEQDADLVLLLQRSDKETSEEEISARLIIAKHRNGPTGRVELIFRRNVTRFEEAIP
jgi:replicative DNA helicase